MLTTSTERQTLQELSPDSSPSSELRQDYTLVLKGHLAVTRFQFLASTTCAQVDTLARQYLWAKGRNYGHGTGHGVGYGTCVHETADVGITAGYVNKNYSVGNVISNEPGFYLAGKYGIRIENLLAVEDRENGFLGFRDLTLFPYDKKLIDKTLLTAEEVEQINTYHNHILKELSPYLEKPQQEWLKVLCAKF